MATSMKLRRLLLKNRGTVLFFHRQASSTARGYYVLLPELPSDTPQDNPLLAYDAYPNFALVSPDKAVTASAKLAINYDVKLGAHLSDIKEKKIPITFASVFDPIEKLSIPLNFGWRIVKQLSFVKGGDFQTAFQRVHQQVEQAKNERWLSLILYNAVKELKADKSLKEGESRLVDLYLLEGKLNGVELTGDDKTKLIQSLHQLAEKRSHFRQRVTYAHNLFSHVVHDFGLVSELPRSVAAEMAVNRSEPHKGPWKVTLSDHIYEPFMAYCADRRTRFNVWNAYNNRCSYSQQTENLSNSKTIQEIRGLRNYIASVVGYPNFAQMSMETKMAGSVENLLSVINTLSKQCLPLAEEELAQLQQFAKSEGFNGKIESWDVPYWTRRQKMHLYRIDDAVVSQYFPLPSVFKKLCDLCTTLFGIVIKDCSGEVSVWHEDVKFYKVFDDQGTKEIAAFYFDPYARSNKLKSNWAEPCRERSGLFDSYPVSFINMNISRPFGSQPALLTSQDVSSLFACFGQALQQLLTTVNYSEIAGQRNIEWDAIYVCPYFMSMLFYTKEIMVKVSGHYETGQPLPEQMAQTLITAQRYFTANDIMKMIYTSAFDVELCLSKDAWQDVMRRMWKAYVPLPFFSDDNHPCSSTFLFSENPTISSYSPLWSKMLAADITENFSSVDSNSDFNSLLSKQGRRFRDTYLSLGGSVSAAEVFQRFQGRTPSTNALLKQIQNR